MSPCSECATPVRPGRSCPACGGGGRAGPTAAAALLGLVASPLFACQEMYGIVVVDSARPGPAIRVEPEALDLGDVPVGTSSAKVVEVQNIGAASLDVSAAVVDPEAAPFAAAPDGGLPWTLEPGEKAGVEVTFAPEAAGAATATLRVASDDPDDPELAVPLEGVGTP